MIGLSPKNNFSFSPSPSLPLLLTLTSLFFWGVGVAVLRANPDCIQGSFLEGSLDTHMGLQLVNMVTLQKQIVVSLLSLLPRNAFFIHSKKVFLPYNYAYVYKSTYVYKHILYTYTKYTYFERRVFGIIPGSVTILELSHWQCLGFHLYVFW